MSTLVHPKLSHRRCTSILRLSHGGQEPRERYGEFSTLHSRLCKRSEKGSEACRATAVLFGQSMLLVF